MSNDTVFFAKRKSVFSEIIQATIDELPETKPAPDHTVSRRLCKNHSPKPGTDLCAGKHGGDEASEAAFVRASTKMRERQQEVIEMLKAHGSLTTADIARIANTDRNVYDPRCTELRAMGVIERTGEMRGGCHVLRLVR
jgi:hypothetical protein